MKRLPEKKVFSQMSRLNENANDKIRAFLGIAARDFLSDILNRSICFL